MKTVRTSTPRTAVITGAGSGLGRDLALGLAARDYRVFGTALEADEVDELEQASGGGVRLTVTDVRDQQAVRALADEVSTATDGHVDLLISNAGILTPGPLEVLDLDDVRNEFEVNVFGVISVINAFLPALRASSGRIVQVSTVSVDFPMPFNGPSAASKAAAETLMTAYRAELASHGVDVVVAVPGAMRTGGPAKTAKALDAIAETMTEPQRKLYMDAFQAFAQLLNAGQSQGMASAAAADEIIGLAERRPPPSRAGIGDETRALIKELSTISPAELDARLGAFLASPPA